MFHTPVLGEAPTKQIKLSHLCYILWLTQWLFIELVQYFKINCSQFLRSDFFSAQYLAEITQMTKVNFKKKKKTNFFSKLF